MKTSEQLKEELRIVKEIEQLNDYKSALLNAGKYLEMNAQKQEYTPSDFNNSAHVYIAKITLENTFFGYGVPQDKELLFKNNLMMSVGFIRELISLIDERILGYQQELEEIPK